MMTKRASVGIGLFVATQAGMAQVINESERDIPIAYDVDVVVAGGTSRGVVAAAVAVSKEGASVFLDAPQPYLGEDN